MAPIVATAAAPANKGMASASTVPLAILSILSGSLNLSKTGEVISLTFSPTLLTGSINFSMIGLLSTSS